ncbi:tryptophan synthase subunit alpha [Candidatus Acidulodesulfobacterium sp. H_13]|uniref:tryptophan synthase subunit alpha n=1 Tax=Candidatus Acidulodesulfobacterium sp. H_13 TaxID=3395470 RepID=UPI003AF71C21
MIKENKIDNIFNLLRSQNKTAFVPFISIGDPDIETSLEIAKTLINAGADIIELGFPFSDPMADGKVIQRSYERALKNRISMEDAFNFIKRLKAYRDIPVIFFTYYNPVFVMGSKFAEDAADAGVDGVLVVDLPPEESDEFNKYIRKKKIYQIFLLTPTTGIDRMRYVLSYAKGFVYYVSVAGVTGARKNLPDEICSNVKNIQGISTIPIGVGFGISSGEQAKAIKEYADAVIIGSKIIQFIESNIDDKSKILEKIAEFSYGIKSCL